MNTYYKYAPNVFLAKCTEKHEKGEIIQVETRRGKENDSIIFNLIFERDGHFYYSIVRADGFNVQEHARRKAEKLNSAAENAVKKSDQYYTASNKDSDFLTLGEPIKVGHHSERRHRKIIEQAHNNLGKCVEENKKADNYISRAEYWKGRENIINESMPESVEFFEYKLDHAKKYHAGLKNGSIPREHSFSLTYANKAVKDTQKKLNLVKKLWE